MSEVRKAREAVCARVGANIYGRVEEFLRFAEEGDDIRARSELLGLLKFFPNALHKGTHADTFEGGKPK